MDAFSPTIALPRNSADGYAAQPADPAVARAADRLSWLVLAAVATIAALTFRDYGLGWDDYTHAQYGARLLSLYETWFRDKSAFSFVNLYLYGGGFDMAAAILHKFVPFDLFETRRLLGAVVGVTGLAITWRIARRIDGPVAGLVALLLLATCPLYYGHMFMNPKDAPFAVAMALFLLGLVRLVQQYPKPCPTTIAIVGLGFGLSIGCRIMAGFGVIAAASALGLIVVNEARSEGLRPALRRLGDVGLRLIPAALLAYAVMAALWPWGVANPLNPIYAIEYFSHFFEKPWRELFDGMLIQPPDMPRSYVPTFIALQLPEILLLLGGAGLVGAAVAAFRGSVPLRQRAVCFAVVIAAALPVAVTVGRAAAMYNGIRHFVFLLPPFAVAGGLAGAWIVRRLASASRLTAGLVAAVFLAGLALPAAGMVRLHPYEYAFFNNLAGGARGAQSRFMLDYWGLAFKQAGQELRTKIEALPPPPAGRHWKIATCGPHPPAHIALGQQYELTWDPKDADFALMLGTFYCARLDAPLMVDVVRDGISFARAYDIRGRSYSTLFAMPPVKQD